MIINKISIIVPAFNEESTITIIADKLLNLYLVNNIKKEIIIINDSSTDNTDNLIQNIIKSNPTAEIKYIKHEKNAGKGAAIHSGIKNATGDYLIIQDADLEYDPSEINKLLKPVLEGYADVVYGSRFIGGSPHRILFFWHTIGNKFLTFLSNFFTNLNLTDMETCYKLFKTSIIKTIPLQEKRFGFEPEITSKIAKIKGIRIYEVGISYYGRTYLEGKKINWKDGVKAIYCIIRYNLFN
jgi:glycosyltransferase involved in cell wall biosynthesis